MGKEGSRKVWFCFHTGEISTPCAICWWKMSALSWDRGAIWPVARASAAHLGKLFVSAWTANDIVLKGLLVPDWFVREPDSLNGLFWQDNGFSWQCLSWRGYRDGNEQRCAQRPRRRRKREMLQRFVLNAEPALNMGRKEAPRFCLTGRCWRREQRQARRVFLLGLR